MDQALPGDAVDWTEADYHATIGQLYAHISLQQKQINVLRQVRDEYVGMIAAAAEDRQRLSEEYARLKEELDVYHIDAYRADVVDKNVGTVATDQESIVTPPGHIAAANLAPEFARFYPSGSTHPAPDEKQP